jgi:ankyrin repeat protein
VNNIPFVEHQAPLEEYLRVAARLFDDLTSGNETAAWRLKRVQPRFREGSVADQLNSDDAKLVIAVEHGFEIWSDLERYVEALRDDETTSRFETAVVFVIHGDANRLRSMLHDHPELVQQRSARCHRATLLHYLAANGIEQGRQKTPENAVEIATLLLDAGADVNAVATMYDEECTTLNMLVSSCHPANAGLQIPLAETLLDHGAAIVEPGSPRPSAIVTALAFGYLDTAKAIARRFPHHDELAASAGLGRIDEVMRLWPDADANQRHVALALAAQHGHSDVVKLLVDNGEDPNRFNPKGYHGHSTPLHQAALGGHEAVVRLLVEQGARLDILDTQFQATPHGWATHAGHQRIADYLQAQRLNR